MKHQRITQKRASTSVILFCAFFLMGIVAAWGRSAKSLKPGVDYIPIRDLKDAYGMLLRTQNVKLRGQMLYGLRTLHDAYAGIIASMFLDDTHTIELTIAGVSQEKRICDIACETLDSIYKHPFGKLPANADQTQRDARLRQWREWFQSTLNKIFGPKGGPLRGVTEPSVQTAPAPPNPSTSKRAGAAKNGPRPGDR